ncbi:MULTISPECIES: DUF2232 domain-containing protein [unclassified Thiocapsa]|uniref:DUF2232 domain-containing protein n=1 Tax=unclassified Thiocapsa TaxID=2641286 RepID=UPI0035B0CCE4
MKAIAAFVMRGPSQAALVAAVTALLSILIPPLGLLSAGSIGLVALRGGPVYGLLVSAVATLGMGAIAWLALGSPLPALGVLLMLWVPILALALLLRYSRSFALTLQVAGALGILLMLSAYGLMGDPSATWLTILEPFRDALVKDGVLDDAASAVVFAELADWMTGAFAAALVAQLLFGLFIARWWQAMLYNPGGFGEEFRELRLGRAFGILVLLLLALLPFGDGASLTANLLLVPGVLLVFQGLAVAHQVRALKQARQAWLIGLYVLVVFFMPQALLLIACVGLVDIWADIRSRVSPSARPPSPGSSGPAT